MYNYQRKKSIVYKFDCVWKLSLPVCGSWYSVNIKTDTVLSSFSGRLYPSLGLFLIWVIELVQNFQTQCGPVTRWVHDIWSTYTHTLFTYIEKPSAAVPQEHFNQHRTWTILASPTKNSLYNFSKNLMGYTTKTSHHQPISPSPPRKPGIFFFSLTKPPSISHSFLFLFWFI